MKSGFVVLIGRSNAGKSTLLNTLVGTKIAAVTHKPQTTRHAIQGVLNDSKGQIVFVDTPGIFKSTGGALSKKLGSTVREALKGIDAVLYIVDPTRSIGAEERAALAMLRSISKPKILLINKSDLPRDKKKYLESYKDLGEPFDAIFEISALRARQIGPLVTTLYSLLPEGEAFYEGAQKTNITDLFWIAEIIREKMFLCTEDEVPYATTAEVDEVIDKGKILVIHARLITSAERYKKMLIGAGAKKIKEIGMLARKELEAATNKKIFLNLSVAVNPHWTSTLDR